MPRSTPRPELGERELRCLRSLTGGSPMTPARIGASAGLSGAVDGETLAALAGAGLVERLEIDEDGVAVVLWRLTDAGAAELRRHEGVALPDPEASRELSGSLKIKTLVPLFGSNRMLAPEVGRILTGCKWVGVPFVGGLSEVPYIAARTLVLNDLHCHIVNLVSVVSDPAKNERLCELLDGRLFHLAQLKVAQAFCEAREPVGWRGEPDVEWAANYFYSAWVARNGQAGTKGEFRAPLSVRWDAAGGDSVTRFRNATAGLPEWGRLLENATCHCLDAFEFLAKCKDRRGHGIYNDPPFPGPGDGYKHRFSLDDHAKLAATLADYNEATVVCRFYDVPLIHELYPEPAWEWRRFRGRKATNDAAPEVLLVRNPTKE